LVKFNATARYTFPLLGQTGFVEADEVYQTAVSPALKVSDSSQLGEQPAYGLTNMFIGVDRGSWSAELLVKNVFDRRAILSTYAEAGSAEGLATYSTVATPRLIGVQFSQKF
jgi:outer membrane receptor protein involved in Fe transport